MPPDPAARFATDARRCTQMIQINLTFPTLR
jgi:hypothetical protein